MTGISGVDHLFCDDASWSLYDLAGRVLKMNAAREDLDSLLPGVYVLRNETRMVKINIR